MTIRAVAFDFFGTLTPAITAATRQPHIDRIGAVLGCDGAAVRAQFRASFAERVTGSLGDLPSTMRVVADGLSVAATDEQIAEITRIRYDGQVATYSFRADAEATLRGLHGRGVRTAVVSDCSVELPTSWQTLPVAPQIDATVFSCVESMAKPDPRMFALAAQRLGVRPDEMLYVGDGGGNELPGAATAGMRAVLLDAADRHLDDAYGRQDDWPGERIEHLHGILDLLAGDAELVDLAHRVLDLARAGATGELTAYVDAGVPVELTDPAGNSLLMLSAYHGHAGTVAALAERGADPDRVNERGQAPLAGAVFKGSVEVIEALMAAGADPDAGTPSARESVVFFERADLGALLDR